MINVHISSTARREGKSQLAVRLFRQSPGAVLVYPTRARQRVMVDYLHLSPEEAKRTANLEDRDVLRGVDAPMMIYDLE